MVKFKPNFERRYPRLERVIAIIALINLIFVFFDLTYLSLRPVYRQYIPELTQAYDPVKGIELSPETEYYQAQVDTLAAQLSQDEVRTPQIESSLEELRTLSQNLLTEQIFVAPHGNYALATIQQTIRERTNQSSASHAFNQFWSAAYLEQQGWQQEITFWNTQVRPFFQTNYFRRVNQWGATVNYFWLLDLPFVLIFAVDIVMRILAMHRRDLNLTWLDVALRRWYDVFLLLPFWRWLRLIPVALRLYQSDLLDLEPVRAEAQRDIIVTVGADLAGIVGIEIIDQMEDSIRQGELLGWLSTVAPQSESDSSDAVVAQDDVAAIANHLYDVSVQHILPRIQPDLEDLIQHSVTKTLGQMPGYPQLHHVPGLGQVSAQIVQQLSTSIIQSLYRTVTGTLFDAEGKEITDRLQRNLREAIVEEFNQHNTPGEIQSRLLDVLEKFKFKYIKALTEAGGEKLAERAELLHRQIS
ncbi:MULTISPECIES: hypothetical protein [unclassified Leptolyngbya]|uniref:hypothetical protein n=1 Tax=unclassified Leptolyngbya TaxID=2650499 RepID=UPI0016846EC9|nr:MULTISPECIES: hypothetical protein [unclassified Leptolyngbya]MBD1909135.1 hypothetical protein [Leptolyngbya sp. FACHB-8]MBD2157509.1 hypothetical protein [Leptolyngbya sp. FACHB-16]